MENRTIRLATREDAQGILDIYTPYVLHSPASFEQEVPALEDMQARIEKTTAQYPWLIYEIDGTIAGYAYATKHRERYAYQWSVESSVYVHDAYHRLRIGRDLYQRLFSLLKLQGYLNVYAGIVLPNPASEHFHASFHFESIGTYKNVGYKLGHWQHVYWCALTLNEYPAVPTIPLAMSAIASTNDVTTILQA